MNQPAHFGNIPARTCNGNGVNIRNMQFQPGDPGRNGSPRSPGPATQINNHGGSRGKSGRRRTPQDLPTDLRLVNRILGQESHSLPDQEFGAAAGNEDAGVEFNPQAVEFCPAQNVLQGVAGNAPLHEGGHISRTPCGSHEKPRLLLGKHTASHPEPIRHGRYGGSRFKANSGATHGKPFRYPGEPASPTRVMTPTLPPEAN